MERVCSTPSPTPAFTQPTARAVASQIIDRITEIAEEEAGYLTAVLEVPENRRLAELLVPRLRTLLVRLSRVEKARVLTNQALGALRAFAAAFRVTYGGLEIGVDAGGGLAASGDMETDLTDLLVAVGQAAKGAERPVGIFIDEVQYLPADDLAALIVALHRIGQKGLPLILFGAGLPQLAGEAKSYAERLFAYPEVGALNEEQGSRAIREPIRNAGADITQDALDSIMRQTEGYPYFLQEWGSQTWKLATESPIQAADVTKATQEVIHTLGKSFFRVRLDRLTPREQEYLRATAELGAGPYRSGEIAGQIGIKVTAAGPLRAGLIRKGMVYGPSYGVTAFTAPMFDRFMRRALPG